MEKTELNQSSEKIETNTDVSMPKVSEPIYTQVNGFYRYNYELQRLEFINNQTKVVAFFRAIPLDQWEALPSQEAYCRNITEQADEKIRQDRQESRKLRIRLIICAPLFLVAYVVLLNVCIHFFNGNDFLRVSLFIITFFGGTGLLFYIFIKVLSK